MSPESAPSMDAETIPQLIAQAAQRRGTAVRHYQDDEWQRLSWAELGRIVREIAGGLIHLGIQPGDRVAILSNTRPEWVYADFGALFTGAVVIPVYQANSPEECEYVLAHSAARVVLCEDESQVAKVDQIRERLPALEHVVAFEQASPQTISLSELQELGAAHVDEVDARASAIEPRHLCTIPYTSGTTGPPKGCMITHGNAIANCRMAGRVTTLGQDASVFLFLPLAHAMTRAAVIYAIDQDAELIFWRKDMQRLFQDLAETKPTLVLSAPALFEKFYGKATAAAHEAGALKGWVFDRSIATAVKARAAEREGRSPGLGALVGRRLANRLVLERVRNLFGGRLRLALSGAAPIASEILDFFDACGVPIIEGYGMTESTAMTTCNRPGSQRFGTVGQVVEPAEVKIAQDGELLMRGPHIFNGYYRDETATEATLKDGWLHSGDIGAVDADGFVTITGRKKDILITSSGKNVSPSNIENLLRQSRWISHAVAFGDRCPYIVAVLTLDPEEAGALAQHLGVATDLDTLATHPAVQAELQRFVDTVNVGLARVEQVRRFAVLEGNLTVDNGELTPTMKVRRSVVKERHEDVIASLYEPRLTSVANYQISSA